MKRIIFLLLVLIVAIMGFAGQAVATAQPDSTPSAEFNVYRNLLETGDQLLIIYQNIPYAVIPDEAVWQTYIWRLFNTDNVTEFGAVTSYAWNDNGYGYNVSAMYWDAATVTANGMVWNTPYLIRLSQNPMMFASPVDYNFNLAVSDYSVLTTTEDVQSELAARILFIAGDLDVKWAVGAGYSLLNETETDTVLSIYGEAFFRGAIYGLQGLCPQVFAYIARDLDLTPRTWSDTYVTLLSTQYAGTWIDTAKAAGAALFGTGYDLTSLIITLAIAGGLFVCTMLLCGDAWHGIADARTGLIVATRMGFFDLGFLALLAALAVIYGATRMWRVMG